MMPGKALRKLFPVIGLLFCGSVTTQVLAEPQVNKLSEGVYSIFEGSFNNLVIVTSKGVVLVDPANDYRANIVKAEIAKITNKPVSTIILSHEHYDHVGGTNVFPNAEVICHETCETIFKLDVSNVVPKKVDVTYRDKKKFKIGGKHIELIYVGPADGIATTLVHLPDDKVLYSADMYASQSFTTGHWMEDSNYLANIKALEKIIALNPTHAVNSHSNDTSLKPVRENLKMNNDLRDLVSNAMKMAMEKEGVGGIYKGLATWPSTLKLPRYQSWTGYDDHLPAHIRRMALSIFHGG